MLKDLNSISPYIRLAMDSTVTSDIYLSERVIFDYELLYVKSGEIAINIEDIRYHGKPGDIFLIKPRQPHSIYIIGNTPVRQPHIHFDMFYENNSPDVEVSMKPLSTMSDAELNLFREDITDNLINPFPNYIRMQNDKDINAFENRLFEIIREFNSYSPFKEILLKELFLQLWLILLREIIHCNHNNYKESVNLDLPNKVKDYINSHLSEELKLDDVADYVHLNKDYLSKIFKGAFGLTPIQYHVYCRLDKAKALLLYTQKSINEISDELGFQSIFTFSRAFKNKENQSPSFYRR